MILDASDEFQIIGNNAIFNQEEQEYVDYFTSDVEPEFDYPTNPIIMEKVRTVKATAIIRTYYSSRIINSLNYLSENLLDIEDSLPYIQELLKNLAEYKDEHYSDPFSSFLFALYDALVIDDSWIEITKEQYRKIAKIVKSLNNNQKIDYDKIDKAINELENMGIDSSPY